MKKKKCAIVFGVTGNYSFALANVLIGIKEKVQNFYNDIIIYYEGLNEEDINALNKIIKCKFIKYDLINPELNKLDENTITTYSLVTLSRFECFNLLENYEYVIWQDVDILVQKDFSDLIKEYGNKSGLALTSTDSNFLVESNFNKLILEYDMYSKLFNSGIMVISDKLKDYKKYSEWCYKTFYKYSEFLRYPDQGIINLLIQEFNIEIEEIDILKYCCHPNRESYKDATIIHAYGSEKFWNSEKLKNQFPLWTKNDYEWKLLKNDAVELNEKPLVSVVMSVYERYTYLKESIESILNQTYENFELIVVIEKTNFSETIKQILESYNDKRIKIYINKEKLGFQKSLNYGFSMSKGKYIARMDDDDISINTRIEKQVKFMENNLDIGVLGTFMQMFMKSNQICKLPIEDEDLKILSLFCTPFNHPTVMIRKEEFEKYNLQYDPNYFTEDYDLWSRCVKYLKFANLPEILLKYRASGENITLKKERFVHKSHLNVMKNQFKNYLNLEFDNNELNLLNGRIDLKKSVYNQEETLNLLKNTTKKILESNSKIKFYNQAKLKSALKNEETRRNFPKFLSISKKMFKPFLNPFYQFLKNRIKYEISAAININNEYLLKRIDELENKIKK